MKELRRPSLRMNLIPKNMEKRRQDPSYDERKRGLESFGPGAARVLGFPREEILKAVYSTELKRY